MAFNTPEDIKSKRPLFPSRTYLLKTCAFLNIWVMWLPIRATLENSFFLVPDRPKNRAFRKKKISIIFSPTDPSFEKIFSGKEGYANPEKICTLNLFPYTQILNKHVLVLKGKQDLWFSDNSDLITRYYIFNERFKSLYITKVD